LLFVLLIQPARRRIRALRLARRGHPATPLTPKIPDGSSEPERPIQKQADESIKALHLEAYLSGGLTAAQISAVTLLLLFLPLIKEQEGHLKAYIKANQCADEAARMAELTELVLK
jgi:hypothetical protein